MPKQPPENLFSILGTVLWGDLADLTMYKNKNKKIIAFAKTWPDKPASPQQTFLRHRFRNAAKAWQLLTPAQKAQWNLATRRASLCMGGYALFVHHQVVGDDKAIQAVQRQTHTILLTP